LWQVETSGPVFSSPLLWKSFVLVGCNDGHLYVVQRHVGQQEDETATLALKIRADSAITASPSLLPVPSQHDDPTGEERAVLAFCPSDNNVTLVGLAAFPHQQSLQGGEEGADQRRSDEQPHEAAGLSVAWRREVAISRRGKKVFSSPVILADRLLCASRDNSIYCFTLVP
jgi:outer membrane protein assembly factor BamB